MATVQDLKRRIRSIRNTRKITKAMELVASARLRRAQARIEAMRPYADRMMELMVGTARASTSLQGLTLLQRREVKSAAIVALTGDRGLAGAFNTQIVRAGIRAAGDLDGADANWYASGRRGVSSLTFRGRTVEGQYTGFTDRPSYANAREIASDLMAAYVDGKVDQVDIFYNRYISPLTQEVTRETLLPLQHATILEGGGDDSLGGRAGHDEDEERHEGPRALVEYEPGPEDILERLVPAYVEISIYRALLESTASEHGARMTAMRNASENASDLIKDLTLQMNRERQAEITQEIMEVVAGAESLT